MFLRFSSKNIPNEHLLNYIISIINEQNKGKRKTKKGNHGLVKQMGQFQYLYLFIKLREHANIHYTTSLLILIWRFSHFSSQVFDCARSNSDVHKGIQQIII